MNMTIHLNSMICQRPFESAPGSHGLYIIPARCCRNAGLVSTPQLYRSLLARNPEDRWCSQSVWRRKQSWQVAHWDGSAPVQWSWWSHAFRETPCREIFLWETRPTLLPLKLSCNSPTRTQQWSDLNPDAPSSRPRWDARRSCWLTALPGCYARCGEVGI